ncbi:hypothetical protein ACGC1H_000061 [Rhizoctonia solani]|uniref:SnoaL-like domain-containing protein n=1 Tax=Rhizoctonia solani TaxID=456999 RepID=A0A8H3BIQ3_9AGAM|nr:unnamed protein product [Rhizoctonia solani]CAE6465712.1 unnamed protein product [Rhizoctonia solani]
MSGSKSSIVRSYTTQLNSKNFNAAHNHLGDNFRVFVDSQHRAFPSEGLTAAEHKKFTDEATADYDQIETKFESLVENGNEVNGTVVTTFVGRKPDGSTYKGTARAENKYVFEGDKLVQHHVKVLGVTV